MPAISVVGQVKKDDWDQFTRILTDSFAASERDEAAVVRSNIEEGKRRCAVAYEDLSLVGFAVLLELVGADAVVLEYLAVDRTMRSRGVGGFLFDHVVSGLANDKVPRDGLILEVESPEAADGSEQILRQRRIGFYERHGATVITDAPAYRVPSTVGPETLPFILMWHPIASTGPLDGQRLRLIVEAVLVEEYELPSDSPFISSVLADLIT
jgi:ribosomal protein S18 acetylase RimI-like enzyme